MNKLIPPPHLSASSSAASGKTPQNKREGKNGKLFKKDEVV